MPSYLCECRGPCRRSFNLTPDTYDWLRSMGAVLTPECAVREQREPLYRHNGAAVVTGTNGPRVRVPTSSSASAINPA